MHFRQLRMLYLTESMDVKIVTLSSLVPHNNDEIRLIPEETPAPSGSVLRIRIEVKKPVTIQTFLLDWDLDGTECVRMLANGFQSWSETHEYGQNDRLRSLNGMASSMYHLRALGDYALAPYSGKTGQFHSWSFTRFRGENESLFLGSLDERNGWTLFQGDLRARSLRVSKDLNGVRLDRDSELLNLFSGYGEPEALWDEYFRISGVQPLPAGKVTGWTSWYYHYTGISESIILQNLDALKRAKIPLDVFQVDDGWQEALGDWLDVKTAFPQGMGVIAEAAKEAGFRPGLWLAPFVCETKSAVFREHEDWLLRDPNGRLVEAGWNPAWGSVFYALDIYHPEVRKYLRKVFHTVLDEWGFGLVKLDFLYAAGLAHRPGVPRSRTMFDAMDFVRELAGDKWILGCGLPLAAGFGKVEYCRIGSDVAGYWEEKLHAFVRFRERISTKSSLGSTIARAALDGRAFRNDPDVFLLRSDKNGLSASEKHALFLLNNVLGSLLFFSDDVRNYGEEETRAFTSMFPRVIPENLSVNDTGAVQNIAFFFANRRYLVLANLTDRVHLSLLEGNWFSEGAVFTGAKISLPARSARAFVELPEGESFALIGTTGHLLPCAEVDNVTFEAGTAQVRYREGSSRQGSLYIRVPSDCDGLSVNGNRLRSSTRGGVHLVIAPETPTA
jgi:hypothetical protein